MRLTERGQADPALLPLGPGSDVVGLLRRTVAFALDGDIERLVNNALHRLLLHALGLQ